MKQSVQLNQSVHMNKPLLQQGPAGGSPADHLVQELMEMVLEEQEFPSLEEDQVSVTHFNRFFKYYCLDTLFFVWFFSPL